MHGTNWFPRTSGFLSQNQRFSGSLRYLKQSRARRITSLMSVCVIFMGWLKTLLALQLELVEQARPSVFDTRASHPKRSSIDFYRPPYEGQTSHNDSRNPPENLPQRSIPEHHRYSCQTQDLPRCIVRSAERSTSPDLEYRRYRAGCCSCAAARL